MGSGSTLNGIGLLAGLAWAAMAGAAGAQAAPDAATSLIPAPSMAKPGPGEWRPGGRLMVESPRGDKGAQAAAAYFEAMTARLTPFRAATAKARPSVRLARLPADPSLGDEGYRLTIAPSGAVIEAATDVGLIHGAVSLLGLLPRAPGEPVPAIQIEDHPRFRWRGLMLDSARHMQSLPFIEALIDQMALYKLNVLHWHLTDDQGWRLQIRKYPRLTAVGAWRTEALTGRRYGGFYTQAEAHRIVAYAAARGIVVVPEIEMPGHATAALVAYPEFASAPADAATMGDWGGFPNLYSPDDKTLGFLEDVLAEVMAIFPSRYIHIGGDEAIKPQWQASPVAQARIKALGLKDEDALQGWFIGRIGAFLAAHGRRLVGWDEVIQAGDLGPDAVVMSWHGVAGATAAAGTGRDAVLTPGLPFYFDNRQSDAADEPPGRGLIIPLKAVYDFDAPAGPHILGVQANVWTEQVSTDVRVEHMAFPRAAALAEVGWSDPAKKDWPGFLARLPAAEARDRELGLLPAESSPTGVAPPPENAAVRDSHTLKLCTERVSLNLDTGPAVKAGASQAALVDIMNPCWMWPGADLSAAATVQASLVPLPFNYQLGEDAKTVSLGPSPVAPGDATGELQIRLDTCQGPVAAVLAFPPAKRGEVARLTGEIAPHGGRHDLCLIVSRPAPAPLWALDRISLTPAATAPR